MHALVLGFLKQNPNPAFIVTHLAQRSQMLPKPTDHSGDGGNGFQNDRTVAVALRKKLVGEEPEQFYECERDFIAARLRRNVDVEFDIGSNLPDQWLRIQMLHSEPSLVQNPSRPLPITAVFDYGQSTIR